MNQQEFLLRLKEALQDEVSGSVVQSNLQYYDSYITDEKRKGRTEEEIMEELGDPRWIARTIIDSQDAASGQYGRDHYAETDEKGASYGERYSTGMQSQGPTEVREIWERMRPTLLLVGGVAVVVLIVSKLLGLLFTLVSTPWFWIVLIVVGIGRYLKK